MRAFIETISGLWHLARLAARSGFRLRGPYWRWRMETAFGTRRDERLSRADRCRAILAYARWVHRMKRWS